MQVKKLGKVVCKNNKSPFFYLFACFVCYHILITTLRLHVFYFIQNLEKQDKKASVRFFKK